MGITAKVRRALPFLWLAVIAVVLYDAWVFYSRHQSAREVEERKAEQESEDAKRTLDLLGQLKIMDLYVVPSTIRRGQTARLCYSVVGAKSLRSEPPIKGLYPAFSHCVEVSPKSDTEYTFYARDDAGHEVSQKTLLKVSPSSRN